MYKIEKQEKKKERIHHPLEHPHSPTTSVPQPSCGKKVRVFQRQVGDAQI